MKTLNKEQVKRLQKITSILLQFDERKGGNDRTKTVSHNLRKAFVASEDASVTVEKTDDFIYKITASYKQDDDTFSTVWVHEDGIASERISYADNTTHPVHTIDCVQDIHGQ